ncbi:MAG: serine/threonine-protein kinase [Gemmataceae bacterium]
MNEPPRPPTLTEVLLRQRRAWQLGQRPTIEMLLQAYPHLKTDPDALLDLIYNEVVLREQIGEHPTLNDYLPRFPDLAEQLRMQFELDAAMTVLRPQAAESPEVQPSTVRTHHRSDDTAEPLPRLEGCDLLDELGRGAMGIVYRGWQRAAKRPVAVKLLPPDVPLGRVRNEVQAVSRLHHPNIVGVYEVKEHEGRTALVFEYVESGNLAQKLAGKPVAPTEAAHFVEVLARAMEYAHTRGVIHRDLKPSNILLSGGPDAPLSRCTPKISDFGLAKLIEDSPHLTRTSDILGTPSYMAPEQASGAVREVGPAADLYALGAILYECLTGRPPFLGQGMLDTLELVRTQEPVPPRELNPSVPRDLEIICLKCLHKLPHRRYTSAGELADDLRRLQAGEPIRARPVGLLERMWKAARRRPLTATFVGLSFLVTAGLLLGTVVVGQMLRAERDVAVRQARELQQRLTETRSLLYTAELLRVAALRDSDPAAALRRLEDPRVCPPELRCFSWQLLWRQCHPYRSIERELSSPIRAAALTSNGEMVTLDQAGRVQIGPQTSIGTWAEATLLSVAPKATTLVFGQPTGRIYWYDQFDRQSGDWNLDRPLGGLALQSDGRIVAINGGQIGKAGTLSLHESRTGKRRRIFKEPTNPHSPVVFSTDDIWVACALQDESIQIWDTRTGSPLVTLTGFDAPITAMAFSPRATLFAAGASDGVVRLWDLNTGRERERLSGEIGVVHALAFHPTRAVLAVAGQGRHGDEFPCDLQLWDYNDRRTSEPLRAHGGTVAVGFVDEGSFWTAGADRTVKHWDFPAPRSRTPLRGVVADAPLITCGPQHLAWLARRAGEPETLVVQDLAQGSRRLLRSPGRTLRALALPSDARFVVSGSGNLGEPGELLIWDVQLGRPIQSLPGHRSAVVAVACAADGSRVVSGCQDGTLRSWRLEGGRLLWEYVLEQAPRAIDYQNDRVLILGERQLLWFDEGGRLQARFALPHPMRYLAANASNWYVGGDQGVWFGRFDVATEPIRLDANTRDVTCLSLSPESQTLAVGTGRSVHLWDLSSQQERLSLSGHNGGVRWVGFCTGGLLSLSQDSILHSWPSR